MVLELANSSSMVLWHMHRRSGGADSSTSATSGVQLAVVILCLLLLRCNGAVDDTHGSDVVVTSEMSMGGRFTSWRRPHGGVRGPDTPAVQSGQMVKSQQTLAIVVGLACVLLKSSSSVAHSELRRRSCTVRVIEHVL